ncbi:hypothetical protein [Micromonospora wenchangensis]|uniref:hypothetical protein n=1 Tax=Micromonospora wenchangensis TaxID=1185415 RepID=UPI003D72A8CC
MEPLPLLSDAATAAMRRAAEEHPDGRPLTTAAVFAALPAVDHEADWERLWLETGEPRSLRLQEMPDTDVASEVRWEGVPLTADLANAMSLVEAMSRAYRIPAVAPGLLAVALVADPGSGAARCLTGHGLSHRALLDLIQSEVHGSALENLPDLIKQHRLDRDRTAARAPQQPSARSWTPTPVRPRLRRAGWIGLSVLAALTIVLAIRTSPSFHSTPPRATAAPFDRPAFAADMVSTAQVRAALGVEIVELQDRPPDLKSWLSNSPMAIDLRANSLLAGWQREWSSTDHARYVKIRVIEGAKPEVLASLRQTCSPDAPAVTSETAAAVRSGFLVKETADGQEQADFCVLSEMGNFSVWTDVRMRGADASTITSSAAQRLAARQVDLSRTYTTTPRPARSAHYARDSINRWLILAAIVVPLIIFLPITLVDRATWRRLARMLRRGSVRDPFVVSVDSAVRVALAQATAFALVKVAAYVWLLRLTEILPIGMYKTAGLLLVAFFGLSLAESRLLHGARGRYSPRPFRGRARLLAIGGLLATAAIAAASFLVADLGLSLAALGFNPFGADYLTTRFGGVAILVALPVLALAGLPLMLVRRIAMKRINQEAREAPGRDILLLRSFVDDNRRLRARGLGRSSVVDRLCLRRWERFEEVIATALSSIGPVTALAEPRKLLPPALGAVRQQFSMDTWQDGVRSMIRESALVCMIVGRTESLQLEMREIKRLGALPRTLFFIPPCGRREQRRRLAMLAQELGIPWDRMVRATRGQDALLIVQYADPEQALIFTGRAPDDIGYEVATRAAAHLCGGWTDVSPMVGKVLVDFLSRVESAAPTTPAPSPPPPVHVYPKGKAPAHRPVYRRFSVLPWLASTVVIPLVVATLSYVIGIDLRHHPGVPTGTATATSMAEDDTGRLYAVLDRRYIAALDPANKKAEVVGIPTVSISDLIVHGSTAYGDTPIAGSVTAVSLTTGKPIWTVQLSPGLAGLARVGELLITSVPAEHRVIALSARDGHRVAQRTVRGIPWGVVAVGSQLVVPIVDRGELLYLSATTLTPVRTVTTVAGPQRVLSQGGMLWVLAPTQGRIVRTPAGAPTATGDVNLLLTDPDPMTASGGGWLAVQGHERISLVTPENRLLRLPLPYDDIASVCVTRTGHVFVGTKGQISQLR